MAYSIEKHLVNVPRTL